MSAFLETFSEADQFVGWMLPLSLLSFLPLLSILKKWTTDHLYYVQEMEERVAMERRARERSGFEVFVRFRRRTDGNRCRSGAEYVVSERQKMLRQNAKSSQDNCGLSGTLAEKLAAHDAAQLNGLFGVDMESGMSSCLRRRLQKRAN